MNGHDRVLAFSHERSVLGDSYKILSIDAPGQLPIDFRGEGLDLDAVLSDWVERRTLPVNRHHLDAILGAINLTNRFDVLCYSHGLSLNDTFWVQEETEVLNFDDINLYDNPFDEALGWIAFTGLPSNISRNLSTPELTTEGVLPKYWQRINTRDILLCKGGTEGYSNAGLEPFAETIAYLVGKRIEFPTIPYHLERRNKKPVSVSHLFTSKEYGLLPASRYFAYKAPYIRNMSLPLAIDYMTKDLRDIKPFYDMCFFDYIIENSDRHLNNWGFTVDNKTQRLSGFAPIWDNGMSLDYERPKDVSSKIDFASFNIKYDFVKTCVYQEDYMSRCHKLIHAINDGSLGKECSIAVQGFERYEKRVIPSLEFIKNRCEQYLSEAAPTVLSPDPFKI